MRGILHLRKIHKPYEFSELQQLIAIQNFYRVAFAKDPPDKLTVNEEFYARYMPSVDSFNYSVAVAHLANANGVLKYAVLDILQIICAYQVERNCRQIFNRGYLDEPIQLLLEELKEQLYQLAGAEATQEKLDLVSQFLKFFDLILASDLFYPTYPTCRESPSRVGLKRKSMTFYGLILRVRKLFEEQLKSTLSKALNAMSSREFSALIIDSSIQVAQNLWLYLVYALRGGLVAAPDNITVMSALTEYRIKILLEESYAGRCSITLARLFDAHFTQRDTQLTAHSNPFMDLKGDICLPESANQIVPRTTEVDAFPRRSVDLLSVKELSGLHTTFCQNNLSMGILRHHFVLLHAFVAELLGARSVCQTVFDFAGVGGDIAVCGVAGTELKLFLLVTETLIGNIRHSLQFVHEAALASYAQLFLNHKPESSIERPWLQNFRFSFAFHSALMKDIERLDAGVKKFSTHLSEKNFASLAHEVRSVSTKLKQQIQSYAQDYGRGIFSLTARERSHVPVLAAEDLTSSLRQPRPWRSLQIEGAAVATPGAIEMSELEPEDSSSVYRS